MSVPVPTHVAPRVELQMIRAEIDLRYFERWMGSRGLQDPDHAIHCLLTECFGDLAPKPFRLVRPRRRATGVLYGYGTANDERLRDEATVFADPLQSRVLPMNRIDSKPMPLTWQAGRRVGFETRVRPVVRGSRRGGNPKAGERDAFLAEAVLHPPQGMQRSREEVYVEWLANQMERRGSHLEAQHASLISFRRKRAIYRLHGPSSEGPDVIIRGMLTITDGAAFANLLARGVGRHRAYGYGMLLLRPARQQALSIPGGESSAGHRLG